MTNRASVVEINLIYQNHQL